MEYRIVKHIETFENCDVNSYYTVEQHESIFNLFHFWINPSVYDYVSEIGNEANNILKPLYNDICFHTELEARQFIHFLQQREKDKLTKSIFPVLYRKEEENYEYDHIGWVHPYAKDKDGFYHFDMLFYTYKVIADEVLKKSQNKSNSYKVISVQKEIINILN